MPQRAVGARRRGCDRVAYNYCGRNGARARRSLGDGLGSDARGGTRRRTRRQSADSRGRENHPIDHQGNRQGARRLSADPAGDGRVRSGMGRQPGRARPPRRQHLGAIASDQHAHVDPEPVQRVRDRVEYQNGAPQYADRQFHGRGNPAKHAVRRRQRIRQRAAPEAPHRAGAGERGHHPDPAQPRGRTGPKGLRHRSRRAAGQVAPADRQGTPRQLQKAGSRTRSAPTPRCSATRPTSTN